MPQVDECKWILQYARKCLIRYTANRWDTSTQGAKSLHPTQLFSLKNKVQRRPTPILQQDYTLWRHGKHVEYTCTAVRGTKKI